MHDPSPARRGVLFEGCSCDAGDFGHHVMASGGAAFECVCGKRGCFETHASAAGLVRHWRAAWRAAGGDARDELEIAISLDDAKAVVERMRQGDRTAAAAWAEYKARPRSPAAHARA